MQNWFDEEGGFLQLPDHVDQSVVERLENVEKEVSRMSDLLEQVLTYLKSPGTSGCSSQQSLQSTQSSIVSSSSSIEGSRSPLSFSFACPLCAGVQHSPKSHCEHMRKVLHAKGECSFVTGNPFHDSVLSVFRQASIFVCWYQSISCDTISIFIFF